MALFGVRVNGQAKITASLAVGDGSVAAPSLGFQSQTGLGFSKPLNSVIDLGIPAYSASLPMFRFNGSVGMVMGNATEIAFTKSGGASGAVGGIVFPIAADLNSGAGVNIGNSSCSGTVLIGNSTGATAIYALLGALSTTVEVSDPKTQFSNVGGTTNSINIYWDSTGSQYVCENRTGSTASVSLVYLGRQ